MGLRVFSIGSFVADCVSVGSLVANGIGTDGVLPALMLVGGTVFPPACCVAGILIRRLTRPTTEVARQMAGFDINFV